MEEQVFILYIIMSKYKLNIVTGVDNSISYNYLYTQCGHHGLDEQVLFLNIITSQYSDSNFKQFKIIIVIIYTMLVIFQLPYALKHAISS